jgi:DMSO/TMAO reductase YedYZ molybdopterin-dependent catalytic subunit
VAGITPVHVPNDRFFRIDTALSVPRVDPARWRLRVHGMVDRELELTFDDLLARTFVEQDVTIACVSNEVGGNLIGNARWLGTSLADLLDEAGLDPAATQVVGRSIDGWTAGFPTSIVTGRRDSLIAVGMNGEPLPPRHGFPARLIVPGLFGYVSATKWLTEIELTTWEAFDAYWVPRGWAKEGPIKTQSRIDVPAPGARLEPGTNVIAGVAWAPTRGVERVEVRVDDGPWATAELSEPLGDATWVQWRAEVTLGPGSRRLQVRATDGAGPDTVRGSRRPAAGRGRGLAHDPRVRLTHASTSLPAIIGAIQGVDASNTR